MLFSSWLRNRKSSALAQRKCPHRSAGQRATFRPRLEALEGRDVPSTLIVTNNLDGYVVAGDGSLRGEIAAAQRGDTIVFAPSHSWKTITLGWSE
jgi:hypothetical protein